MAFGQRDVTGAPQDAAATPGYPLPLACPGHLITGEGREEVAEGSRRGGEKRAM